VDIDGFEYVQRLGSREEDALDFLLTGVGPVASQLAEAASDQRTAATAALRELLSGHMTPRGVEFDSAVWIVTARAPGGS
jgi:hypothetical protein